jgi:ATP-dependent DNA helicase RecG
MTSAEKEEEMRKFTANETQVLVATSVVEVGVNVPNATVILIEGAERFGLAQLHQLRGRVIRSSNQAYCFLQSESKAQATSGRLKALVTAKNGFELAEQDLALRGSGELYGAHQWGVTDVAMEALSNLKMVEAARNAARNIIETDPTLMKHPLLAARITLLSQHLYGE